MVYPCLPYGLDWFLWFDQPMFNRKSRIPMVCIDLLVISWSTCSSLKYIVIPWVVNVSWTNPHDPTCNQIHSHNVGNLTFSTPQALMPGQQNPWPGASGFGESGKGIQLVSQHKWLISTAYHGISIGKWHGYQGDWLYRTTRLSLMWLRFGFSTYYS